MEEEYENASDKISNADFITTLFSAVFEEVGKNKPTVEPVLSEAFNELGVPEGVIVGFKLSPQDSKLLKKSEKLSPISKCLLAASIVIDFMDAAAVGEKNGDLAETKRLTRNLLTTFVVYQASKLGSLAGKNILGWAGGFIGTAISPGAGTVIGKIGGSIVGGVGGGFLAGWYVQTKLDEFFEKRGW